MLRRNPERMRVGKTPIRVESEENSAHQILYVKRKKVFIIREMNLGEGQAFMMFPRLSLHVEGDTLHLKKVKERSRNNQHGEGYGAPI